VIVVDQVSLIRVWPVRAKIRAREIAKIEGYLEIFIEGVGFDIKFIPENPPKKVGWEMPKPDNKVDEGGEEDEDDDDLYDFDDDPTKELQEGGKESASTDKSDQGQPRQSSGHKDKSTGKGYQTPRLNLDGEEPIKAIPIAVFDPVAKKSNS
jgi:hypothetical protein